MPTIVILKQPRAYHAAIATSTYIPITMKEDKVQPVTSTNEHKLTYQCLNALDTDYSYLCTQTKATEKPRDSSESDCLKPSLQR